MERKASSPLPPPTNSIPHVLIGSPSLRPEPGYETLPEPSLQNDDPGYETVKPATTSTTTVQHHNSLSASDYDPNYEVLRHNSNNRPSKQHTEASYAKVWDPSDGTINDVEIKARINSPDFHDYAKISDRSHSHAVDRITENDDDHAMSDIYSSISTVVERSIVSGNEMLLDLSASHETDPNYSTISETRSTVLDGSGTSTAKTTPSTDSSLTPIDYSTMKNSTSTTTTITLDDDRPAMYESLTGSESDPNYESVRYTDNDKTATVIESPYERLYSSHSTPIAMTGSRRSISPVANTSSAASTGSIKIELTNPVVEVDDYFQV